MRQSLWEDQGGATATDLVVPGPGVPMYIASQQPQQQQGQQRGVGTTNMMIPPPRPNVVGVIRMALTTPPRVGMVMGQGPSGQAGQGPSTYKGHL